MTTLVTRRLPAGGFAIGPVVEAGRAPHHDLADNLSPAVRLRHQPLRAGVAETSSFSVQADLRGDAQRAAVGPRECRRTRTSCAFCNGSPLGSRNSHLRVPSFGNLLGGHFGTLER